MQTEITSDHQLAAQCFLDGGIVVFPTETVYGIGASSLIHSACKKIYTIKNRPTDNPLIVHTSSLAKMNELIELSEDLVNKLKECIPGPITIIGKKKEKKYFLPT